MEATIIQQKIIEIRGEKVMLDFDLAILFGVETKRLNEQVKRNQSRFPIDFMFQLTEKEWIDIEENLQFSDSLMRSQIATASIKHRNKQYMPYAFTEHGVTMLSCILKNEHAVFANIFIVRAFIALRQAALHYKELYQRLALLENSSHKQFKEIYQALNYLIEKKKKEEDFSKRRQIGFNR